MARPLTARQIAALKRLAKAEGEREMLTPDLARQLHNRGIAKRTGRTYQRSEWQRKVVGATLWEVELTAKGRAACISLGITLEDKPSWRVGAVSGTMVHYAPDGRHAAAYETEGDKRGRYSVRLFADGDQFDCFADDLDKAWKELNDAARMAKAKRAAENEVENRN